MKMYCNVAKPILKQLILSSCLFAVASTSAWAQSNALGGRGANAANAANAEPSGAMPLPSLTGNDTRQAQAPLLTRPGKTSSDVKPSFEAYAETVTGKNLNIFGKDLFSDVPSTFAPFDGAQVNSDYVVGAGDELQIRGWGMVDIDISATVNRSGEIYIPRVGAVKVSGVAYRDLQGHLKKAVSKMFTNFDLTVSISQTRAVQIYVVGHAMRPGTYTLGAMSTLLNALFTSGGPNAAGTMRNIQVKRGSKTVTSFDLYDVLVKGDKSHDIALQDGDVIYIPEVGPLVALSGNVKKQAIFELKGSTSLADIVGWAGGVDSAAEAKRILIEKNVDNNYQTVVDITAESENISSRLAGIPVKATDILRVFAPGAVPVQIQIQNEYVRVSGEVKQSGVFQLKKGETLRELVTRLGGATDNGYIYAMQLNRESVRRLQQAKLDEVADRFERDLDSNATQRIGSSNDKDNAAKIAIESEQQRSIARRLRAIKAEGRIVLELQNGNAQVKDLPDLPLQDGDSVFIPRRPHTIDVIGSVFQQNAFVYRPSRTVNDYLELAGGPTVTADKSEMYVIRADGTAQSGRSSGWFSGVGGNPVNPGDTVVVPEKIERSSFTQSFKEWTTIFYQFGLGAAGLKVLKD